MRLDRQEVYPSNEPIVFLAIMNTRDLSGTYPENVSANAQMSPYVTSVRLSSTAAIRPEGFLSRFKNIGKVFISWHSHPLPKSVLKCMKPFRKQGMSMHRPHLPESLDVQVRFFRCGSQFCHRHSCTVHQTSQS